MPIIRGGRIYGGRIFSLPAPAPVVVFQGSVSGYTSGGFSPAISYTRTIDKFSFASDANATNVGLFTQGRYVVAGQSSTVSGYSSGGSTFPATNVIDKFPFSSDANATSVGILTQTRSAAAGQSSTASGYSSGGFAPGASNVIDKFPFASDANATNVGSLITARQGPAGQQI